MKGSFACRPTRSARVYKPEETFSPRLHDFTSNAAAIVVAVAGLKSLKKKRSAVFQDGTGHLRGEVRVQDGDSSSDVLLPRLRGR